MKRFYFALLLFFGAQIHAQSDSQMPYPFKGAAPPYTKFLDEDFSFKELTIAIGEANAPDRDVVSRSVVLPLGDGFYVAFDTELLRVAAVWSGEFSAPLGVSFSSYALPLNKIGGGFRQLASPSGTVFSRSGIFPGWQDSERILFEDTRSAYIDDLEPGRGPMDPGVASWQGIFDTYEGALLTYSLFGGAVTERFSVEGTAGEKWVERRIRIEDLKKAATLVVPGSDEAFSTIDISPCPGYSVELRVRYALDGSVSVSRSQSIESFEIQNMKRWPERTTSSVTPGKEKGGYALDLIELPYPNPWKRRIRPVDIKFTGDGAAILLTFDGDLYRLTGLDVVDSPIQWQRIAAGFNEPQTLCLRGDELFVYSRGGVSRLWDLDGDHEIDRYEMFCNRFVQSPDTRDFPSSIIARNDGSLLISKCGQQVVSKNPHSGRILKISPDGKDVSIYASGLRNAFLAYDADKDLVTASDQQGEWIPSTPLLQIEEGAFYGYAKSPSVEDVDVSSPMLWFPHRVAPSGVGQVHGLDDRSLLLSDSMLYLEYHRPSIHRVSLPGGNFQALSASQLPLDLEIPLLNGAVNPADGAAYVVGFQIWDSTAPRLEGIGRLREYATDRHVPTSVQPTENGLLLTYREPLDAESALDPSRYQVSAWDYRRTSQYGSAQYNASGSPGIDTWFVHTVYLSDDRRRVFLAIPHLRRAMQVELITESNGEGVPTYLTINDFHSESLESLGFDRIDFSALFAREPALRAVNRLSSVASVARGQEIYTSFGCIGCHSIDGTTEGKSGPSFLDLYSRQRLLSDGSRVKATREYLKESILTPGAKKARGYDDGDVGMPSYSGILKEDEIESILLFLESL